MTTHRSQILIVDNYDSFTFNLVHAIEAVLDQKVEVKRVDETLLEELRGFHTIIFSPGSGLPSESPNLIPLITEAMRLNTRILGVCLGLQALAVADGGALKNLNRVRHGVSMPLVLPEVKSLLFRNCGLDIEVGRYHSWVIDESRLSPYWKITSRDSDGEIMSMEHSEKPFFGIQFHPESVLTPEGRKILRNFLIE